MKIDVFFDVYPHPAKPYFESQLAEWEQEGHELRLFSQGGIGNAKSTFPITFISTLREQPVRLILLALWRSMTNPIRSWRAFRCGKGLARIKTLVVDSQLPRDPPDVNFVHNLATALMFSHLKYTTAAKLAIYYHGGEIPGVRQISLEDSTRALERADIVFSNTRASVNEVISRGAVPERTAHIPVGFPLEKFPFDSDRSYLRDDRWNFVCLGRMAREKGFDIVLRAVASLKNFHLTFIGGGPELENLKALATELSLNDRVTFLGYIQSYEDMVRRLGEIDALVFAGVPIEGSNFRDTQATVMQEAMLMGAVVVASTIGGIPESLPERLHPYLYQPGSVSGLAARLTALMELPRKEVRSLGIQARQFVVDNYDIQKINGKLLTAF